MAERARVQRNCGSFVILVDLVAFVQRQAECAAAARQGVCGWTDGRAVVRSGFTSCVSVTATVLAFTAIGGFVAWILRRLCWLNDLACVVLHTAYESQKFSGNKTPLWMLLWETTFRRAATIGKWSEDLVARCLLVHARLPNKCFKKLVLQIVGISENCEVLHAKP